MLAAAYNNTNMSLLGDIQTALTDRKDLIVKALSDIVILIVKALSDIVIDTFRNIANEFKKRSSVVPADDTTSYEVDRSNGKDSPKKPVDATSYEYYEVDTDNGKDSKKDKKKKKKKKKNNFNLQVMLVAVLMSFVSRGMYINVMVNRDIIKPHDFNQGGKQFINNDKGIQLKDITKTIGNVFGKAKSLVPARKDISKTIFNVFGKVNSLVPARK